MDVTTAKKLQIAVVGPANCDSDSGKTAFEVGCLLAENGAVVLCGGRGGVMERAAAGVRSRGGSAVGILPGQSAADSPPNPHLELELYTGFGQGRNLILVLSSAATIAIGGGWGTLSEIALAIKHGIPVISVGSWRLERPDGRPEPLFRQVDNAAVAVEQALLLAQTKSE